MSRAFEKLGYRGVDTVELYFDDVTCRPTVSSAARKGMHKAALAEVALPARTKELMALAISVVKQCDGCIAYHARAAARQGATAEEVAEALGVTADGRRHRHGLRPRARAALPGVRRASPDTFDMSTSGWTMTALPPELAGARALVMVAHPDDERFGLGAGRTGGGPPRTRPRRVGARPEVAATLRHEMGVSFTTLEGSGVVDLPPPCRT